MHLGIRNEFSECCFELPAVDREPLHFSGLGLRNKENAFKLPFVLTFGNQTRCCQQLILWVHVETHFCEDGFEQDQASS